MSKVEIQQNDVLYMFGSFIVLTKALREKLVQEGYIKQDGEPWEYRPTESLLHINLSLKEIVTKEIHDRIKSL